jgi:hypothetical protein
MILKKGFGAFGGLIDQSANNGCNRILVERAAGTIILLDFLIVSMKSSTVAGPLYSRLLIIDGAFTPSAFQAVKPGKFNDDITSQPGIDGSIALDTVVSSMDPPFILIPTAAKPFRIISGVLNIVLFSAFTQAGVVDGGAWGFLSADGHEELSTTTPDQSLQFAHLR